MRSCDCGAFQSLVRSAKSCSGVAQDRFAAFAAKRRTTHERGWQRQRPASVRPTLAGKTSESRFGLVQTSARSGLELSQQVRPRLLRNCRRLGAGPACKSRRLKKRRLAHTFVAHERTGWRALQQIEDPARRTRSAAQRRRGSRLVGIRSRSARSTTVHANHSQPIANHSRSSVRSRHYRREGNSKRAVRRAQKRPPGPR